MMRSPLSSSWEKDLKKRDLIPTSPKVRWTYFRVERQKITSNFSWVVIEEM
jgi:hypothetical protein